MPVEFIGMIGTSDQSEIRHSARPGHRPRLRAALRPRPRGRRFDRVLIGYGSVPARRHPGGGVRRRAYRAAGFLVAHRPGFVAPTLAARTFATLDQFTGGRIAVHIITGGSDAEQRRDGDHLAKDERYDRTDEYLDILKLAWTSDAAVQLPRPVLPGRGLLRRGPSPQQPRIPLYFGGSSAAAYRVGGKHADIYALWGEPLAETASRSPRSAAAAAAGRAEPPGSASRSARFSALPRSWPGNGRTGSWPRRRRTSRFRGQWRRQTGGARRRAAAEPGLPAAAGRGGQGRAARPRAVDAAGRRHRRRRQLHRAGRHPGDRRPGAARLRGHRRDHAAHPGL